MKLLFKPWNTDSEGWDVDFALLTLREVELRTLQYRRELALETFARLAAHGHPANALKFFDPIQCPVAYEGLPDLLPEALHQFVEESEHGTHLVIPDAFDPETIAGFTRVPTDGHYLTFDDDGDVLYTACNKHGDGKLELPLTEPELTKYFATIAPVS